MLMPNKYRKGGVKSEHTIIPGLGSLLRTIALCPHIHSITPGRISRRTSSEKSQPHLEFQYFQETGLKLIGKSGTAVQEVFVVSSNGEKAYQWLVDHNFLQLPTKKKQTSQTNRKSRPSKGKGKPKRHRQLTEASPMTVERYYRQLRKSDDLSALTEEQKQKLEQYKKKLEQEQQSAGPVKPQRASARPKARTKAQAKAKTRGKSGAWAQGHTDNELAQWLQDADAMGEEHWQDLLRKFTRNDD
ncbi:MAG: hypothetical protein GX030_07945 [Firmicutes bacterium]|nr:hypothetical protein [Bacillota bacterium]